MCCLANANGIPASGSGFNIPGAVVWTFANDGGPSNGIIVTTDAVPVFRTWGTIPNVGDAINCAYGALFAQEATTGNRAAWNVQFFGYARNAVGENAAQPYPFIAPSGYDETASGLAPWNTGFAFPAGMAGGMNFLPGGNIVQVAFNGLAGVTFNWKCMIIAFPFFTATIQV